MARILSTSNRMLIPSSRLNTLLPTAGQVLTSQDIHRRAFTATPQNQAGGKNKIKVSNKGKFKDHPLGGPGMEEAFDIERDLAKPFAMEDVPAVTHLRWAEARKRLNKLRAIKFQIPELTKYQQPFVPPPPEAHVIVRTQDDMGFHRGQLDTQRPNKKASIQVNLSKIPELTRSKEAMHKFKLLSGKRWFESEPKSQFDLNDHYDDPEGMVKISCDDYPTAALNQKWCSDTLDRLIKEATDLQADPMSDIPLDSKTTLQRRHRNRHRPWSIDDHNLHTKFPKEWLPDPIRIKLDQSQEIKKSTLLNQKEKLLKIDNQIRQLINWNGLGLTPTKTFFASLNPKVKSELDQLLNERNRIRDMSAHFDRHYLPNFMSGNSPHLSPALASGISPDLSSSPASPPPSIE
ncbi:hypothetical protein PCASD_08235 [Puccinia coronata f. sp. avenae]|uniref:Small ribosomal subunit protein mS35 mitochondrial conserved domain-containing protein n=1 Tax=Puccinia coronata f. sp. avenae TaxID=200324 RepID=A0A2N5ULH4_9BASI|nr:hypothetical protein PCASD_08235 [Puccinia coronata f. sp. avenae]